MLPRSILPLVAAALMLIAISHSGYAQTIYDADTTISTPTDVDSFDVTGGATLTVTTDGVLSTQGAVSSNVGTVAGFGSLLINGSGVVNVEVGFPSNLTIGHRNGLGGELTVEDDGILNIGNAFVLASRTPATINLSDNGAINVGVNGPPSDEFRVG